MSSTPSRPSQACLELVEAFEGFRPKAVRTAGGGWTLGYGHTLSAREGATVGPDDAETLLIYDLGRAAAAVAAATYTPLGRNEADALSAFVFNVGEDAFRGSTVLKRLNEGDHLGAAFALERWRNAEIEGDTQVVDALVRRRAAEKALFLTPSEGFPPAPTAMLRPLHDAAGGDPLDARAGRAVQVDFPQADAPGPQEAPAPAPAAAAAVPASEPPAQVGPRPAMTAAAASVTARLQQLFPESPPELDSLSDAPFRAPEATDAPPLEEPEPFPAAPVEAGPVLAMEPAFDPAIPAGNGHPPVFTDIPPTPPDEPEAPPFPHESAQAAEPEAPFPHAEAPDAVPPADRPASTQPHTSFVEEARAPAAGGGARLALVLGVVGLGLFVFALVSMLGGRATGVNLIAGLLGVFCLAFAGADLVLPWLGRGGGRDR